MGMEINAADGCSWIRELFGEMINERNVDDLIKVVWSGLVLCWRRFFGGLKL